jgi:predicted dehydrogenase
LYFGTPGDQHSLNLLEALKAGKHVYIEKPVALNTDDSRAALGLAREQHATVMVCMNVRNYWPFPVLKKMLEEGMLGNVFFAQQDYIHDCRYICMPDSPRFHSTYARPMHYFYETAVHPLDTLAWLLGPISRVTALKADGVINQTIPGHIFPSDCVSLQLEFSRPNLIGRSLTNFGYVGYYAFPHYGISLYGSEGTALPDGVFLASQNPDYEQVHDPERWVKLDYHKLHHELGVTADIPPVPYEYEKGDPSHVICHLRLFKRLLPALRTGSPVDPGLVSNAQTLAVLEASMRSLQSGRPETVDYTGFEPDAT